MRKVLLFLFFAGSFSAQNVEFGDINFKKAIIKAYPSLDVNKDNEISFEEALAITSIRNLAVYPSIVSAKGVEAFVNLTELDLSKHKLTSIDISSNTKLTSLNLRENKLEGVFDASQLPSLRNLELTSNFLTEIILPENGKIEFLYANENKLSQIELSKLENLKRLFMVSNQIKALDLSNNLVLERLHIDNNEIASLNLSNLAKLNWMSVNNNLLSEIIYLNNPLLKTILAQNNRILSLNFQDGFSNAISLINLTGNTNFSKIIKDCIDALPNVSVSVEYNCSVLGLANTEKESLRIFPDPTSDILYFSKSIFVENYKIFSLEGKLLNSKIINNKVESIPVDFLHNGLYILNLKTKEGEKNYHFLKK